MKLPRLLALLLILSGFCSFVGCSKPAQQPPPPPSKFVEHRVSSPGETLGAISAWYTGSKKNWKFLQESNPGLDPSRIRVGQVVLIPRALAIRSDPMGEKAPSVTTKTPKAGTKGVNTKPSSSPASKKTQQPVATEKIAEPEATISASIPELDLSVATPKSVDIQPPKLPEIEVPTVKAPEIDEPQLPAVQIPKEASKSTLGDLSLDLPDMVVPTAVPIPAATKDSRDALLDELLSSN